jgi:hypothetical protein
MLKIKCLVVNNPSALLTMNKELIITKGPRDNSITPITIQKLHKRTTVTYAVIPKPEAIAAFEIIRKCDPQLTLKRFLINYPNGCNIQKYNGKLVNVIKITNDETQYRKDAIKVYTQTVRDETDFAYDIVFKMMASDRKNNMTFIQEFLTQVTTFKCVENTERY